MDAWRGAQGQVNYSIIFNVWEGTRRQGPEGIYLAVTSVPQEETMRVYTKSQTGSPMLSCFNALKKARNTWNKKWK